MTKEILSGNEAIGLGAYLAGVAVASAYPGTPSSEIIPAFSRYGVGHAEWCTNEKVALEVAVGASFQGGRSLAAMKHVGLNVAADPLFSVSYAGVGGGLVIITADDVGMFSSQNEQDNRHLARASKCVLLEPADSQECLDFVRLGFEISEQFDTPVIVRTTTRVSHAKGVVEYDPESRAPIKVSGFERNMGKWVLLPAVARRRRVFIEERLRRLEQYGETAPVNRIEWGDRSLGIISSGISYQYAREAVPNASFLKLGLSWPLPPSLVEEFVRGVKHVVVVEETEPILESEVRMLGLDVLGKRIFTSMGEYSADLVRSSLAKVPELGVTYQEPEIHKPELALPDRPPVLCPGCSHRGVFYTLNRLKATVFGDIGCYTLGAPPPLSALHACLCMGASVNMAFGAEKAAEQGDKKDEGYRVAVIGDSTFVHSGITGMINAIYNQGHTKLLILDNGTTAMTGHQDHPGTGVTLTGDESVALDFVKLARTCGVEDVKLLDPFDLRGFYRELKESLDKPGPSVIVAKYPCIFVDPYVKGREPVVIDAEKCNGCGICLKFGCPGVYKIGEKAAIDPTVCSGCEMCLELCPTDAAGVRAESKRAPWETVLEGQK